MNLTFTPQVWEDYLYRRENDARVLKRVHELMKEIQRTRFQGIDKTEPLKMNLAGYWSRRITEEHRIVYKRIDGAIAHVQMRYHYRA